MDSQAAIQHQEHPRPIKPGECQRLGGRGRQSCCLVKNGANQEKFKQKIDSQAAPGMCFYHSKYGAKAQRCKAKNLEGIPCPMGDKKCQRQSITAQIGMNRLDSAKTMSVLDKISN